MLEQITCDLNTSLDLFKDRKKGLQLISRKTGIHEKTLLRLLSKEHKPGYLTVYKLYRYILQTESDTEIIKRVHPVIASYLKKHNPKNTSDGIEYSVNIEQEILKDRTFSEIFFMAGSGNITKAEIKELYGLNGLQILEKMLRLGVLQKITSDEFTIGQVQANLSTETLKVCGLRLVESFYAPPTF